MRLLKLAALCLLLIMSFTLTLLANPPHIEEKVFAKREKVTDSELPVLLGKEQFPVVSAQGVIAVDLDSAVVLYEKNADFPLLPASTTKILTALVALETYSLDMVITVPNVSVDGQKMKLVPGEKITVENLLYGLLVFSANDAAEVLAESHPDGREAFINLMNTKAGELKMQYSFFVNPTGLDNNEHVSTARDMIKLAEVGMKDPTFAKIVNTKAITVKSIDNRFVHRLTNINQLLGKVEGVQGIKTGWTQGARENLVTYINRDNKRVIVALLGSQDRFGETKELIDWIYSNYVWQHIAFEENQNRN